ncbi:hypothetical protein D1007_37978 [Hordeum vulgare]|nr:hypothetical protein D1007_37978 [Hordeum vulgare]
MMRNNRIFQSLGIDAIASMIRKTNDVQQGTTNGVQEGSGVISDDPEYNPKEDEVVVHKTVKVQTLSCLDEETTLCMVESGTVCVRLRHGAPSIDRNDVVSEEEQQLVLQPGKFTFSFTSAFCKWK